MTSAEIRQRFLDFFASKGHHIVSSAPIVVKDDPTLLFTNAGMNPFKDYFLGNQKPPYPRVADTQKCLRVSGKHNDLEEVGVDTYHHTMFEMLGNWSFGDYFKKEAIQWSWELLTQVYRIPEDRLYASVFEGDPAEGLPPSSIALSQWQAILPEERIVFGNKKDNFWEMGDTGPCGPCSEIHIDCRPEEERAKVPGRSLINKDHPQVIEIWNNVFIQFNRQKDGTLVPLEKTHVDTGMGLERLVRVLQGKTSNYDTDLFSGTISCTETITRKKYTGSDALPDVAFRVIADHIRAIGFTIADGQLPSNTGAGYVIRRILRRAVRYYQSYLQYREPLLCQLMPELARQFQSVFPELHQQLDFVVRVVREEEESFLRTLEKGLRKMDELLEAVPAQGIIDGPAAFELYDTFGFPIDLTRLIAREQGRQVDEPGFEREMQAQKQRSRHATTTDAEDWMPVSEHVEVAKPFVGYDNLQTTAHLLRYRKVRSKGRTFCQLVLDRTPFYAESGGQTGDTGWLQIGDQRLAVTDTRRENDLILHIVDDLPADVQPQVEAIVDTARRRQVAAHHTATHLLHAALRAVLGTHAAQKGSLVDEEGLRFDFSHISRMTTEELREVEAIVNARIRQNIPILIREMPRAEAIALGAMALFGEKYGDVVRVVTIDPAFSVELCGGTHAGTTGELGFFAITSEAAVAAGVRRVTAVCGPAAEAWLQERLHTLEEVREALKGPVDTLKAVKVLHEEVGSLRKQVEKLEARILVGIRNELLAQDEVIEGISFVGSLVQVPHPDALKTLCIDLRNNLHDHLVVLCANIGGKPYVAIGISDTIVQARGFDAGQIIRQQVAPLIRGGGGGQKNLATAGGQDASRLSEVPGQIRQWLRS
ncbi:MAG: alanine--tRNA ligase [Bacteroidetes bacterium]|nr:alanine--tRNA ligase [Bacteroidota bacterium]